MEGMAWGQCGAKQCFGGRAPVLVQQLPQLAGIEHGRLAGELDDEELAREVLDIAHQGLARRQRLNGSGDDETGYLDPLHEIVRSGKVPAQRLLDKFHGEWGGDISRVYDEAF